MKSTADRGRMRYIGDLPAAQTYCMADPEALARFRVRLREDRRERRERGLGLYGKPKRRG